MKLYVATNAENKRTSEVIARLRIAGHEVYDFPGFNWAPIQRTWRRWRRAQYHGEFGEALRHPRARAAFRADRWEMEKADACVLLLPCGGSAHVKAGYFAGRRKPLFILLDGEFEPELVYLSAAEICLDLDDLVEDIAEWEALLEVKDA